MFRKVVKKQGLGQSQKLFSGPWPDMMLLEKALANLNMDAIDFISVNSKFSIYFVHR
jgi:hypothetical protein